MRPVRRYARIGAGLPRRLAVALASLLTAFALVCGFAHANGRYFYCEAMGLMATDPCASAASRDVRDASPESEARRGHTDCCEIMRLPSLPQGTASASPAVPPPGLVAVVPAAVLSDVAPVALRPRAALALSRWRAPPRSAARERAQQMVFL